MRLEVIGQPYHKEYVARLHTLAEGKNVVFRHNCQDADLTDAYRRAMCIVLPSVYRTCLGDVTGVPELLGQTLLEGMACGAAAICTDVASMPEIVLEGVTGFIVPPNNPQILRERLVWLQDHRKEADLMGAAGRQRVLDQFNWKTVVKHCLELYSA
jgi:glycosyltransferase involved in cell wall biosynthesis